MPVFRILYRSQSNPSYDFAPHDTELVAPKGWDSDEVTDAFQNQFPYASIISCTLVSE